MLNHSRILCYPDRYSTVIGKKRFSQRGHKTAGAHKSNLADNLFIFKAVGIMVMLTMMIGVGSTFWYGRQMKLALADIGRNEVTQQELTNLNRQLTSKRNLLLDRGNLIAAASKVGVFPPSANQLR